MILNHSEKKKIIEKQLFEKAKVNRMEERLKGVVLVTLFSIMYKILETDLKTSK